MLVAMMFSTPSLPCALNASAMRMSSISVRAGASPRSAAIAASVFPAYDGTGR